MNTSSLKRLSLAVIASASLAACSTMTPEGADRAEKAVAVTASNKLIKFNAGRPDRILATLNITGLQAGETLLGIDYRVAKDQLYALGSSGRLYTINEDTAVATDVGTPFAVKLEGTQFGFDFNPTVDRIRVVSNTGQNLRLHPDARRSRKAPVKACCQRSRPTRASFSPLAALLMRPGEVYIFRSG